MTSATNPNWRLVPGLELHWHSWNQEHVVYEARSGHTHLLNPLGAVLLQEIERGNEELAGLVKAAARALDVSANEWLEVHVEEALEQLSRLRLVQEARE